MNKRAKPTSALEKKKEKMYERGMVAQLHNIYTKGI